MKKNIFSISVFVLVSIWLLLGSTMAGASEMGNLPPRPPTATPIPPTATPIPPTGGLIILNVQATQPVPNDLWTNVQWQDDNDGWHDVEGWRGTFNENLNVIWWVAPEDLGKGPFRWVVYEEQTTEVTLAISESFYLPSNNKAIVEVVVLLP